MLCDTAGQSESAQLKEGKLPPTLPRQHDFNDKLVDEDNSPIMHLNTDYLLMLREASMEGKKRGICFSSNIRTDSS